MKAVQKFKGGGKRNGVAWGTAGMVNGCEAEAGRDGVATEGMRVEGGRVADASLPVRRSREVLAGGGWERQRGRRMRCHRIPT